MAMHTEQSSVNEIDARNVGDCVPAESAGVWITKAESVGGETSQATPVWLTPNTVEFTSTAAMLCSVESVSDRETAS